MTDVCVWQAFVRIARATPEAAFLRVPVHAARGWAPAGLMLTYGEVLFTVARLRDRYREAGYGQPLRVATVLANRPEFFFHYLALNSLGVSLVPINPDYRHDEMLYQMEHSEACLVVALPDRIDDLRKIAQARANQGGASLAVVDGLDLAAIESGALPAAPVAANAPAGKAAALRAATPGLETEAALLYTSGTTGRPKGCRLSNFYFLNAGEAYRTQGDRLAIETGREVFYNPLPLHHMNALAVSATCAILSGNSMVLVERFSP